MIVVYPVLIEYDEDSDTYFSFSCKHYLQNDKGEDNVKATGVVRRIDDLGRVVIPKEIRRTMRMREGACY